MYSNVEIIAFGAMGLAAILFVFLFFWMAKTEKRLKKFFTGAKAKNLEEVYAALIAKVSQLEEDKKILQKEIAILHKKSKESIRGVETLRFNPFKDAGSNQSFAIALLNENKDGVLLSSLYSRERVSVFAKPVKQGTSEYDLSAEEKEVLKKASNF